MKKFINDESGATAIEYGLIAAAMGLMLVLVMPILAGAVSDVFNELATGLTKMGAAPAAPSGP
jgi:pilus assembly protein Flp/PilA